MPELKHGDLVKFKYCGEEILGVYYDTNKMLTKVDRFSSGKAHVILGLNKNSYWANETPYNTDHEAWKSVIVFNNVMEEW